MTSDVPSTSQAVFNFESNCPDEFVRAILFVVFVVLVTGLVVGAHLYVYRRLVKGPGFARLPRLALSTVLAVLGILIPAAFLLPRLLPASSVRPFVFAAFVWIGLLFYLMLVLGARDVYRLFAGLVSRIRTVVRHKAGEASGPGDPSRRLFLARLAAGGALAVSGSVTGLGLGAALGDLRVPLVKVRLARLPSALSGFRIAVLADLHLGPVLGKEFLETVVARTNALKPDLIAIVGDLVDLPVERLKDEIGAIGRLRARQGVFFVTGNHEFYSGPDAWMNHLRSLGIVVLANQRVSISAGGSEGFDLAGVHDYSAGVFSADHRPDLDAALAGRDPARELVLLAHQPRQVFAAARAGVGLQISGHTHGGQIWPFGVLTRLSQPYLSGLHRHAKNTQIYVTRGTGFWGPPLRILAPPEISQIQLLS